MALYQANTSHKPLFLDFHEARALARSRLPRTIFEYIDRGTEAETALQATRNAFDRRRIIQRSLRDVSTVDLTTELFGRRHQAPFMIAPTALAGLVYFDGELEVARAAESVGISYCAATQASTRIEGIRGAAEDADLWFQLYHWSDIEQTFALLDRVKAQGIDTLLITVDTPGFPKKIHNTRNGFSIPLKPSVTLAADLLAHPRWTLGVMGRYVVGRGIPSFENYPGDVRTAITKAVLDPRYALDKNFGLDRIAAIRDRWDGRIIVKGIQHPDDAKAALDVGAEAIVISSHGGRNNDSSASPLYLLPRIRAAVGDRATIFADSGVQKGSDIAKLIAAGADAVLCGRAFLWALAAGGQRGIEQMAGMLASEMANFLAFSGLRTLEELRVAEWLDEGL